jgi:ribokinase
VKTALVKLVVTGCINWDINLFIKRFPIEGEEVIVHEITRVPGGTAANVSVAAARLLTQGDVAFIGGLGTDVIGANQVKILEREGVDASGIKFVEGVESGQAYITIDEKGQNCIHTFFGANLQLLPTDLTEAKRLDLIKKAKVIVIMDPPLETAIKMAQLGKANDAVVVWDPGVYVELGLEKIVNALTYVDYFILNHIEFKHLLGTNDPKKVGKRLAEIRKGLNAIIKQGAKGSTLVKEEGEYSRFFPSISEHALQLGMKVVNTVGCGDAFIGAYASSKVQGLSDEEAVTRANYAGAFKATRQETRGSPTKVEFETFIKKIQALQ